MVRPQDDLRPLASYTTEQGLCAPTVPGHGDRPTDRVPYVHAGGGIGRLLDAMPLGVCNGCDGCGYRCTSGVPMTRTEFDAVVTYLARHPRPTRSPQASGTQADPVWGEACRFRDAVGQKCMIYPVRPLVCRLMGHVWWLPCPIERIRKVAPVPAVAAALEEYCRLERHPYERWEQSNAV